MARKIASRVRALGHVVIVVLTMMTTLWSSLGVVVVPNVEAARLRSAAAAAGEWYRCQGHACGCQSAAACRALCCCFGPAAPAPVPAPSRSPDDPSTQLSWRDASCAGTASWILSVSRSGWLPTSPDISLAQSPHRERLSPLPSDTPAWRGLAVDPPPPRVAA